jgi:TetR/AcrR family transcriptional regulator, regulator of autoinduction and epiphytic fitness
VISKPSFKQQMLRAREDAVLQAANRLLATKGFDLMTLDDVATEVGISKASLYHHFESKEDLAAATMARAMTSATDFVQSLPASDAPLAKLKAVVRWVMRMALAGQMPSLPSQNSTLRAALARHREYMDGLMSVSDTLGAWIEAAQAQGQINPKLPPIVVLYTLYARACDPVLEFLKASEQYSDEQILEFVSATCFEGLQAVESPSKNAILPVATTRVNTRTERRKSVKKAAEAA